MQDKQKRTKNAHLLRKKISELAYSLDNRIMKLSDKQLLKADAFVFNSVPGIKYIITINTSKFLKHAK